MSKLHWVAMAGQHGCLPNCVTWGYSRTAAAESLQGILDFGKGKKRELVRDWIVEFSTWEDEEGYHDPGNEYAELIPCTCDNPEVNHAD